MKKKKVLVVTSSFPRSTTDWWAQFVLNIYKFLPKKEFDVTILAPHAPGSKLVEELEDNKIIRFPYFFPFALEKLTSGSGILHSSRVNIFSMFQIPLFISSQILLGCIYLLTHEVDVVHAHWILPQGILAVISKKLFRKKVILTVHGSDIFGLKKYNWLKKIILNSVDMCTVNSSATQKAVLALSSSINTKIIPMGVDTLIFSPKKRNRPCYRNSSKGRKQYD